MVHLFKHCACLKRLLKLTNVNSKLQCVVDVLTCAVHMCIFTDKGYHMQTQMTSMIVTTS